MQQQQQQPQQYRQQQDNLLGQIIEDDDKSIKRSKAIISEGMNEPSPMKKTKKNKRKLLNENPFDDLKLNGDSGQEKMQEENVKNTKNQWIKPKLTPLTIDIVDFSKVNRFYGHKSIQKYIRYLFAKTCPNPMWLSIKRQSQVQRIVFVDVEIENSVFYELFQQLQEKDQLGFLRQFNLPSKKANFKEAPFLKESRQLWQSVFVYDQLAVKNENKSLFSQKFCGQNRKELPQTLNTELLQIYQTYLLTQQQRKSNLYPTLSLPIYKDYFILPQKKKEEQIITNNDILIIDCEMVMSARGFELARASIINFSGELIYDQFFKPDIEIINYNTQYSGITQQTLENVTKTIQDLHTDLSKIMDRNTILVGHSLENDLNAMKMIHQKVIDTSVLFQRRNGSKMKLKTLANQILKRSIQVGSHCSEEDCLATLQVMRHKIELVNQYGGDQQGRLVEYHLLKELQEAKKKVVIIDQDQLDFIKHSKDYLGVQIQQIGTNNDVQNILLKQIPKYLRKDICQADVIFSKIRSKGQQWSTYYKQIDEGLRELYENKCPDRTVFFINFQVNKNVLIYPQNQSTLNDRNRPFCLIMVKAQ